MHEVIAIDREAAIHGGRFFTAIGTRFDDLRRLHHVVPADVLDAWFDPAPAVLERLSAHLGFALRTSPPVQADGLIEEIARHRGVQPESVLAGGGSSDLMFGIFPHLLTSGSCMVTVRPAYGEYEHLASLLGASVCAFELQAQNGFELEPAVFAEFVRDHKPAVAVLVRPNNPVGGCVDRIALLETIDFERITGLTSTA